MQRTKSSLGSHSQSFFVVISKGDRSWLFKSIHSSDTKIPRQSQSSLSHLAQKHSTCHHLLPQEDVPLYTEAFRGFLERSSTLKTSFPPWRLSMFGVSSEDWLNRANCQVQNSSSFTHLAAWLLADAEAKPKSKHSADLPRKVWCRAPRGRLGQAGSLGLHPWHWRRARGTNSTASAQHKMTQFKEALTGKTHTQELPDRLFPHPAALTLHSQQEQQQLSRWAQDKGVLRQIPKLILKHALGAGSRRSLMASLPTASQWCCFLCLSQTQQGRHLQSIHLARVNCTGTGHCPLCGERPGRPNTLRRTCAIHTISSRVWKAAQATAELALKHPHRMLQIPQKAQRCDSSCYSSKALCSPGRKDVPRCSCPFHSPEQAQQLQQAQGTQGTQPPATTNHMVSAKPHNQEPLTALFTSLHPNHPHLQGLHILLE